MDSGHLFFFYYHWLFVLPMRLSCTSSSSGGSRQAGPAQGAGLLPGRLNCQELPHLPFPPAFLLTCFLLWGSHPFPSLPFSFQRVLFYISQAHHRSLHNDAAPLLPQWLRPSGTAGGTSQAAAHHHLHHHHISTLKKPSQSQRGTPRRSPPSLPKGESMLGTCLRTCPPHWTPLITLLGGN